MGRPQIPVEIKNCKQCGAPMPRKAYGGRLEDRGRYARRQFCNQQCMAAWQEGRIKTPTPRAGRLQATKTMKPACEHCGSTTRRHVHHRDENPLNNAPSNLQTLCVACHRLAHSQHFNATTGQRMHCAHCANPAMRRGLCWTHLTRFRKYGDPLARKVKVGSSWLLQRTA